MDPVFGVMLDVARIVTFQPRVAGTETRRTEREADLGSAGAAATEGSVPAAISATSREPMHLPRWFRFSLSPR